jgi:prolyl-tRNA editing enzyme YbaK/EbsC (Cys-tRNA(Pro) deacylase)
MAFDMNEQHSAPDRVRAALINAGLHPEIRQFAESTRTAQEAANALGISVGQIVKSLLFMSGERPVMALISGSNQLDTAKLSHLTGAEIRKADAATVRQATGYAIGGVPPLGFPSRIETYMDTDLLQYEEIWAAAGTPNHVFRTTPTELTTLTEATRADLKRG